LFGSDDFAQLNASPTASGIAAANIPASVTVPAVPFVTYFPGRDDSDSRRGSRFHSTAVKLEHLLSGTVTLQSSYQRVQTNRVYRNGPSGPGFQPAAVNDSTYTGDIDTASVRTTVRFPSGNQWTAGYEFEREHYADLLDNNLPGTQHVRSQTDIRQNANAIFLHDQTGLLRNRLQISLSGRVQSFSLQNRLPSPPRAWTADVSTAYIIPATSTKLRAHAGNAYRAPALYERFGGGFSSVPATGELVFTPWGDPSLSPDRYNSVDGGLDQYVWRDRVRLSASYFYTRAVTITAFDSGTVIKPATDPYGRSAGYINGSGGLSRGAEFSVESRPANGLTLSGSYTYSRVHTDRDITVPGFRQVLGVALHTATVVAGQRIGNRAQVAMDVVANSENFGSFFAAGRTRAYSYPGVVKADLSGSLEIHRSDAASVKVHGRIENLLNRKYFDLGWQAPGTTFVTGLTWMF
jgi:iron complex outermembrane receptor protein